MSDRQSLRDWMASADSIRMRLRVLDDMHAVLILTDEQRNRIVRALLVEAVDLLSSAERAATTRKGRK